jgi:hypothetical protein
MIFLIRRKMWQKSAFLTQAKSNFAENVIITLVLEKNANFFCLKLEKIAENCDPNIGPRFCYLFTSASVSSKAWPKKSYGTPGTVFFLQEKIGFPFAN